MYALYEIADCCYRIAAEPDVEDEITGGWHIRPGVRSLFRGTGHVAQAAAGAWDHVSGTASRIRQRVAYEMGRRMRPRVKS